MGFWGPGPVLWSRRLPAHPVTAHLERGNKGGGASGVSSRRSRQARASQSEGHFCRGNSMCKGWEVGVHNVVPETKLGVAAVE